ncbi:EamA family transporter [Rhodobacterales bacterium HKCCE3408]|nr:EamA family transporter [Rhodobacterales bacterium HKCCE3408]
MDRKQRLDAFGAASLTAFSVLLGANQVVIKLTNEGLGPVFAAGLRSTGGIACILLWMAWRGIRPDLRRGTWPFGVLLGLIFALEFVCLFLALDLTTVARASVVFYSMPVWLTLAANFLIPGERMGPKTVAGLAIALAGVAWAMGGAVLTPGPVTGDLLALAAAICWAGIALIARATPISKVRPETQLLWQLVVSAPVLVAVAPAFGPLLRDPTLWTWAGLGFQTVLVVSAGFLFWFWLLTIYPAGIVASFAFLTPIFGVAFGAFFLGEPLTVSIVGALALVCLGLWLITRR